MFHLITHQIPTPENLCKEGILTLSQLITLENQKLGYKLYNNMLPTSILKPSVQTAVTKIYTNNTNITLGTKLG